MKQYPDGRREEYPCELLYRDADRLVVRFRLPSARDAGGFRFPADSVTHGYFWRRRPYVLYVMRGPRGRDIARRFDVVGDVRLRRGRVEYTDLALDVWLSPSGRAWLEDEDELEALVSRGHIDAARRDRVLRTGRYLLRRGAAIAARAEAALSGGVTPRG